MALSGCLVVFVGEGAGGGGGNEEDDDGADDGDRDSPLEALPALFLAAFCDLVEILERHCWAEGGPAVLPR